MTASLLLALRRRLWLLLVVPVLVGAVVFLTTPTPDEAPEFISTALVAANPSVDFGPQRVRQDALLVRENIVVSRARELFGSEEPLAEFRNRVSVEADIDSLVIRITTTGDDPVEVQEIVQAYGDAFIDVTQVRANDSVVREVFRRQAAFDQATQEYDLYVAQNTAGLTPPFDPAVVDRRDELFDVVREAEAALEEVTTRAENLASTYEVISAPRGSRPAASTFAMLAEPPVRGIAAVVITLLAMVFVIGILDRLRPRVTDRLQVEQAIDAPVLTMVPRVRKRARRPRRIQRGAFQGPGAEAHRTLRVHLQFLANGTDGAESEDATSETGRQPIVAVVSPAPGDGKTTTTAMLALAFAQTEADTLVIGCDFRRPAVHDAFGIPLTPGLTDRRRIDPMPDLGSLIRTDSETGVRVLPSGRPSSHSHDALLDAPTVIKAAGSTGHVVILDTAPILVASETSQLAALADFVVMVVHAGKTSMRALTEAATTLRLNNIDITGVVMIGSPEASDYSYYYGEYRSVPDPVASAAQPG